MVRTNLRRLRGFKVSVFCTNGRRRHLRRLMPINLGGAVGTRNNIQSVTTILDVSSILVNWLVEPMCTVLDMTKWYGD